MLVSRRSSAQIQREKDRQVHERQQSQPDNTAHRTSFADFQLTLMSQQSQRRSDSFDPQQTTLVKMTRPFIRHVDYSDEGGEAEQAPPPSEPSEGFGNGNDSSEGDGLLPAKDVSNFGDDTTGNHEMRTGNEDTSYNDEEEFTGFGDTFWGLNADVDSKSVLGGDGGEQGSNARAQVRE
ncbi:unnamed protein product [Peniophora sp. CBMAI 1063]|nr:unnamed protein product [Peniophora sp. CBMAI 1063]